MAVSMRPNICLLVFIGLTAGDAAASGFPRARVPKLEARVSLDSAGTAAALEPVASSLGRVPATNAAAGKRHGGGGGRKVVAGAAKPEAKTLMRREVKAAGAHVDQEPLHTPLMASADVPKTLASKAVVGEIALRYENEQPCDPSLVSAAQLKAINPHSASTIPDKDDENPCTKLAKRLTPSVVHGHVIIKEPDGNTSEVPSDEDDRETVVVETRSTKNILKTIFEGIVIFCVVCALCGIAAQRLSQESKAKSIRKKRDDEAAKAAANAAGGNGSEPAGLGVATGNAAATNAATISEEGMPTEAAAPAEAAAAAP